MRRIELQADRRRLLCDILVLRPNDGIDADVFHARGLIDTGATVSGIGPRPIAALGLRSYGKKPLGSATEERMVNYHLFQLAFDAIDPDRPDVPQWPFLFERIDGFSWSRQTDFDVIVGMDILLQCDVTMARGGRFVLTFG